MIGGRRGFTLIEILVATVVTSVIGVALAGVIIALSSFASKQEAIRDARAASRSALNVLLSDLRMVEVSGGVVSAAPSAVTVRVPYAFGVVCDHTGGATVGSLLPVDSVTFASAGFSGYAWRDAAGNYQYEEVGVSVSMGNPTICDGENITTLSGGAVLALVPDGTGPVASPFFLFQRITYEFKPSAAISGRIGLWRTVESTGVAEELVAPFDESARFRFYVLNNEVPSAAAPVNLANLRGLQLQLDGASLNKPKGGTDVATFNLSTAVFFKNRLD